MSDSGSEIFSKMNAINIAGQNMNNGDNHSSKGLGFKEDIMPAFEAIFDSPLARISGIDTIFKANVFAFLLEFQPVAVAGLGSLSVMGSLNIKSNAFGLSKGGHSGPAG